MYAPPHPHRLRAQRGASIIEIMIGLVLGMFAVLVILQLLTSGTTQQRLTGTSADAQTNAATALHMLTREATEAGLGIGSYTELGCSLTYTTTSDTASVTLTSLGPVTVNPAAALVPAGDDYTDTLLVISGSSAGPSEGDALTATSTATTYTVTTPASFAVGDYVVAAATTRPTACALTLGQVTAIDDYVLTVSNGTAGLWTSSSDSAAVYNLGSTPTIHAYAIRNGNLTMCDYMAYNCGSTTYTSTLDSSVWVPVASHIVSLRAQYARDASTIDGVLDTYDQTSPASEDYCSWQRVLGLRMAITAQSQQYQKDALYDKTASATTVTWPGSTAGTTSDGVTNTAAPISLGSVTDWQHYRYKRAEATVPLRNIVWNDGKSGC
ncbi:MAG: PilW family protein [Acidovorax sp.]|uniref:PilW family protein n=1 Tax=Acidovorax sp. TaxID=1872122 RepID=UPI0039E6CA23